MPTAMAQAPAEGLSTSIAAFDEVISTDPTVLPAKAPGSPVRHSPPPAGPALLPVNDAWVSSTLASLSLEEKIGQMIMPFFSGVASAQSDISAYGVTGFIFSTNTTATVLNSGNTLQAGTSVPLLFSVDCETGLGARITGATRFPHNMALGASADLDLATTQGRITARECRSLGIHVAFGPVLDVNTEPVNPVIGIRSYSDDTSRVTSIARAFVDGARAEGLLVTFKHFPGHGPTDGDSHETLPVVHATLAEIENVHVAPYRQLVSEGRADLVMSAHVWFTALDPGVNAIPATLSSSALNTILRQEIGYDGVVISDAFNMAGLTAVGTTAEAARTAVNAGVDLILMPSSIADVFNGIRDGVASGTITTARIDQAVARILRLKSRSGLDGRIAPPTLSNAGATCLHPDHVAAAKSIGNKSIRAARLAPGVLPLQSNQNVLVVAPANSSSIFYTEPATTLLNLLAAQLPGLTILTPSATPSAGQISAATTAAASADRIVYVDRDWKPDLVAEKDSLIAALRGSGKPFIWAGFGNPYRVNQFSGLQNFLCAFSSQIGCQEAMADVLLGTTAPPANAVNWPISTTYVPVSMTHWSAE